MKKLSLALAVLAACASSHAATQSAGFTVTVNFTPACTVGTVTNVDFGTYTAFAAAVTAPTTAGAVPLTCSRGVGSATYAFDAAGGSNFGLIPTANLNYTLSSTPTRTPGLVATAVLNGIGSADTVNIAIAGTIPQQAGANVTAQAYTDTTRSVTITF